MSNQPCTNLLVHRCLLVIVLDSDSVCALQIQIIFRRKCCERRMSLYIDSEANFKSRALAVGIDEAVVNRAVASGIRSLASYAFASTYQPGSNDDTPLRQLVAPWLGLPAGTEPTAAMMEALRVAHSLLCPGKSGPLGR